MKIDFCKSIRPEIISSISSISLAALLGSANPAAKAVDAQLFRVSADAATVFTSIQPNGQITWTSAVPNINYTLQALPVSQVPWGEWGAVVSGFQSGSTQTITVSNIAGPANIIAVRTYFYTNIVPGVTVALMNGMFQQRAQTVSGADGRCWFYDAPADSYSLTYNPTALYASYYYGTYVTGNVGQSNSVNVYLAKNATQVQPSYGATVYSAPTFSWAGIPEAAYYQFLLYRADPSQLTQVDSVGGLFQTNYLTTTNFESGKSYYINITGYDIWAEPVLYYFGNFYAAFSGFGGGVDKAGSDQRVFGVLQCGSYPITNAIVYLTNTTAHIKYVACTDSQGWFDIEGIPAGSYTLVQPDTSYMMQALTFVTMPSGAGHQGVWSLIANLTNLQPARHATVTTHTPVFSWTGTASSAYYVVSLTSGPVTFSQNTGTATSLTSPVSLPNGTYYWNVTGYDVYGNEVSYAFGGQFTVAGP